MCAMISSLPRSTCVFWIWDMAQQGRHARAASQRHGCPVCGATQWQPGRNSAVHPAWRSSGLHGAPHQRLRSLHSWGLRREEMMCDQMAVTINNRLVLSVVSYSCGILLLLVYSLYLTPFSVWLACHSRYSLLCKCRHTTGWDARSLSRCEAYLYIL